MTDFTALYDAHIGLVHAATDRLSRAHDHLLHAESAIGSLLSHTMWRAPSVAAVVTIIAAAQDRVRDIAAMTADIQGSLFGGFESAVRRVSHD